jgi:hypothetical protein
LKYENTDERMVRIGELCCNRRLFSCGDVKEKLIGLLAVRSSFLSSKGRFTIVNCV